MNEQRQQAYLDLIERLLNCPSGEEPEILEASQDLLDADFLQMLEAAAEQQVDENAASWLRNLANHLREALNLSSPTVANISEEDLQAHWQFLMEVLQAIAESKGDARVVYPLLEKNTQYLNLTLAELLRRWATNKLAEVETDVAQSIAGYIAYFSYLIQQFPLGDKANNMEIAIAGYEVLTMFTKDAFPKQWADTQNNLGIAYSQRIVGEKAKNRELAIASYTNALSVRTFDAFPQQWASTQYNLGNAYGKRINGEKSENIELAIASYTNALEVYTKDAFPKHWADTQYYLGVTYHNSIKGEKAEYIKLAITSFNNALSVYTKDAFPQDWADTQSHLGAVYCDRIKDEKGQNIELAIASFNNALSVKTKDAFPQDWAIIQNNLGVAYVKKIKGEKGQNIELAIASFTNALSVYTFDAAFPQDWADTQSHLGNAYSQRIKGDKAQNIEQAIASFNNALSVKTKDAFPQDWAMTQNNLGVAYGKRIVGEKAQNIEQAITSYENALSVYTKDAFPEDWADTQSHLGNAYSERIKGDKAQNIEQAIASFTNALSVYTFDAAFPQDWASTQYNLGNAYGERIVGEKAENLELAIACFTNVLSVITFDAFPQQWASTQYHLGIAYGERIVGEKAENLELAITSFNNALSVKTKDAFPQDWADMQSHLGNNYLKRIKGDKAQNIELAIEYLNNALDVYTKDAFPHWAITQTNLGVAYATRIKGDKTQNIESAIEYLNKALDVYTKDAFPKNWADTQNNLGAAYNKRIKGEEAENIELAITSLTNALSVRTKDAFPQEWANTQINLGTAYKERIKGDKAQNIESAIASYTNALEVYTNDAFPQNHAQTLFNLGILYLYAQRLTDAYNNFYSAIKTAEFLRGEIVSGDEVKRKQAEDWNMLYHGMVEVCLKLKKSTEAIEYIERSKTRNLVELLFSPDLYPKVAISEESKNKLQQLQQEIEEEKRRVEQAEKSNPQDINRAKLNNLRQTREKLTTRIISLNPISYNEIHNLLNNETAIIQFYIFGDCFRAFIITRHNEQPEIWQSQPQDLKKLGNWMSEYLQLYFKDKNLWRHYLNDKLSQLAEILHIQEILSLVPQECKKVILIPHLFLHLLPLHALPLSSEEYLIDKFPNGVSYAPSCQLWRVTQNKAKTLLSDSQLHHLFAIQNPTDNLEFTDIEVETIAAAFHPRHILKKSEATAQALKEPTNSENFCKANWLHFACHGYFNFNSPEKSALQLAASEISPLPTDAETSCYLRVSRDKEIDLKNCLTLEDIFQLNLPNCRLVTLSACETGFVGIRNISDEYIGLPSGFIRVGAASIVSSLWAVNDFCTALLMIKFYENLQTAQNVPYALNQAQQWFRRVTQSELLQWLDGKTDMNAEQKQKVKERLEEHYKPEERPFKQPYSWACFSAIGE